MEDSTPRNPKKSQKDRVSEAQARIDEIKRREKDSIEENLIIDLDKFNRYNPKRSIHMGIAIPGELFNSKGGRIHTIYALVTLTVIALSSWLILGYGVSKMLDAPNQNPVQNLQFK